MDVSAEASVLFMFCEDVLVEGKISDQSESDSGAFDVNLNVSPSVAVLPEMTV